MFSNRSLAVAEADTPATAPVPTGSLAAGLLAELPLAGVLLPGFGVGVLDVVGGGEALVVVVLGDGDVGWVDDLLGAGGAVYRLGLLAQADELGDTFGVVE